MGKRTFRLFVIIGLLAVLLSAGCGSSKKRAVDGSDYFGITDDSEAAVVIDNEICEEKGLVREQGIYLPWYFVWSKIDSGFYFERSSGSLYLTLQDSSHVWTEDDGSGSIIFENEEPYILSDHIAKYSDADVQFFEDPYRVVINTPGSTADHVAAAEDTAMYERPGNKGGLLRNIAKDERLALIAEENGWSVVTSSDGYSGYVESALLVPAGGEEGTGEDAGRAFEKIDFGDTVRMVWDFIEFPEDNRYLEEALAAAEGVNVISPTWYSISDMNGGLTTLAEGSYVQRAHSMGLDVWPMISDYIGDSGSSGEALSSLESRRSIIDKLMADADAFGFDGVNVDLEKITETYVPDFIQFLRELSAEAHERSLIVSVDNYVPMYFGYYDRTAQIEACDYIIVMAYDEHTTSSDEIGSVASLPFVREGIEGTLAEVPADRLILGVPFYTRGWTEVFGEEAFTSETLGMEEAENYIKEHGIDAYLYWDGSSGQHYGTSTDSYARYSIWQEDADSLKQKLDLVREYSLAGASAWRLGFEKDTIWKTWTDCLGK